MGRVLAIVLATYALHFAWEMGQGYLFAPPFQLVLTTWKRAGRKNNRHSRRGIRNPFDHTIDDDIRARYEWLPDEPHRRIIEDPQAFMLVRMNENPRSNALYDRCARETGVRERAQ